jgi:hypothetical protein
VVSDNKDSAKPIEKRQIRKKDVFKNTVLISDDTRKYVDTYNYESLKNRRR